jgi:hypothetical protein
MQRVFRIELAQEVGLYRRRIERGAIVEGDALANREDIRQAVFGTVQLSASAGSISAVPFL